MQGDLSGIELEQSGSIALPLLNRDTFEADSPRKGFFPSSVCPISGIRLDIGFDLIAIEELASNFSQSRSFLVVEASTPIGSGSSLESKICANGIDG